MSKQHNNIFIGQMLKQHNNIFIGPNAGKTGNDGIGNVCIGDSSDVSTPNAINQIVIGRDVVSAGDNTITFPNNLTTFSSGTEVNFSNANGGCLYPVSSSRRWNENVQNIDVNIDTSRIYNLRPVTFKPLEGHRHGDCEMDLGLIAEEVNEHIPLLVPKDSTGEPASVKYSLLSVLLLAEIKKMKLEIDKMKHTIEELLNRN